MIFKSISSDDVYLRKIIYLILVLSIIQNTHNYFLIIAYFVLNKCLSVKGYTKITKLKFPNAQSLKSRSSQGKRILKFEESRSGL